MSEAMKQVEVSELSVVRDNTVITPMSLVQMAVEQNADLDKLERLMDMQERWETNESRKAYNQAIAKFRAECPAIKKTKKAHNSKYAGLSETIEQIKPHLEACGLSHSWHTDQSSGAIAVTCKITHALGHSDATTLTAEPDKSGSKNSIQSIGSTVTYLQRYTLGSILGLASTDDFDNDGNTPDSETIDREQCRELEGLIDTKGTTTKAVLDYFKINALDNLPISKFGIAQKMLKS